MSKQSILPKRYAVSTLSHSKEINSLTTKLLSIQNKTRTREFAIISGSQLDGKTSVATSLALNYAQTGRTVLLVNANPYDAGVYAQQTGSKSFSNYLNQDLVTDGVLSGLTVASSQVGLDLVNGPQGLKEDPSAFSRKDAQLKVDAFLQAAHQNYDLVLFDGAAFDEGTAGLAIAVLVKKALIILRRDFSKLKAVDSMMDGLRDTGVEVVGSIILNDK